MGVARTTFLVDPEGRITGAKVVFHNENYIVHDRVRQRLLDAFLAREAGRPLRGAPANLLPPDFVAGATISARAMRAAVPRRRCPATPDANGR